MSKPAILVIDIGTTYLKAALFDYRCHRIDGVLSPHNAARLDLGAAAERWWTIASASIAALSGRHPDYRVTGIGLTGFMHSVVALEKDGTPIPFLQSDSRTRSFFDGMLGHFGVERIYQITGSRLDVTSVPSQVLAWREQCPGDFSKIAKILPIKDYIRYRLTGGIATDEIDACGTMFYDIHQRKWDPELLSYCGLDEKVFPPVLHCTEQAGTLHPEVAERLNLPIRTPVAVGGGDDIEILGSGACAPEQVCAHVGSTGSFLFAINTPRTDPANRLELYPSIAREEWVLGGSCSNVTRALDWFLASSAYNCDGTIRWGQVRDDLSQVFSKPVSNRPFFLPYLYGERAPVWEPDLCGIWIGLRNWMTVADLLFSVVEGICFSLRNILEAYVDLGLKVSLICSSGGLNQLGAHKLRASLYGKPIRLVRGADPTSFATAAITLRSMGELSDPRDATGWLEFEADVEPERDWQTLFDERFSLFADHTRQLASEVRSAGRGFTARQTL